MSQITRCPTCATSFKVVADQLRISEGWVRCGQCKEVFDAAAHLLPAPPPALLPDVSLTDALPPSVAVVRKTEIVRPWGGSVKEPSGPEVKPAKAVAESLHSQVNATQLELAQPQRDEGLVLDIPAPTVPGFLSAGESGSDHDPLVPFVWHTRRSPAPVVTSAINALTPIVESSDGSAGASHAPMPKNDRVLAPGARSAPLVETGDMAKPAHHERPVKDLRALAASKADAEPPGHVADAWLAQRGYPPLEIPESAFSPVAARDSHVAAALGPIAAAVSHPSSPLEPLPDLPKVEAPASAPVLAPVDDSLPAASLRAKQRNSPDVDLDAHQDDVIADPADEVSFVVAARRKAFWRRPVVRLSLVILLLLSILGLAVQMAVQERDRVAAMDARTRPWLLKLCEALHCKIAPPRQISDVVIDSSSFNKARGDSYQLTLVMKSTSTIPLAMPAVELTLTDAQDQPVLRRVFLPADMTAPVELAARGEWATSISLIVTTGGARVAGYRLVAFYP